VHLFSQNKFFFQVTHILFVIALINFVLNQNSFGVIFAVFSDVDMLLTISSAIDKVVLYEEWLCTMCYYDVFEIGIQSKQFTLPFAND